MVRRAAAIAVLAVLVTAAPAGATSPETITLTPGPDNQASASFTGAVTAGTAALGDGESCFGADGRPDAGSGCDVLTLNVDVPADFYERHPGVAQVALDGFGLNDIDLRIWERGADGTRGKPVAYVGSAPGVPELASIDAPRGSYYVVAIPYTVFGTASFNGRVELQTRTKGTAADVNRRAPRGFPNHRASHDRYTSHSETSIAMDPLDHDHLMAASKMYENNEKYLFKVGTYESFDGGRTWKDLGHLPDYCDGPGQCDPADESRYRTTSDPVVAFDDEGNAYANVLDAPGGTFAFRGFNMTFHIKPPGRPWSEEITAHDNRTDPVSAQMFLDDKNWIAVDNVTDVDGGPNRPRDGKTGTIYMCWSFDGTGTPPVPVVGELPLPIQQIVMMRSLDGGRTWGGFRPGDNTPQPLSLKTLISGIGCHIAIGPRGEVYVTWYDNQINALMQVKSTNRGESWSPPAPIATIQGIDMFEGETFRNLSIPTSAVDPRTGHVYVAVASRDGTGAPIAAAAPSLVPKIKRGTITARDIYGALLAPKANDITKRRYMAGGDGEGPGTGADIILFKSTNGGQSYGRPRRVNQDAATGDGDQFQPWMDVTPSGQVNVMYFDRRDDPDNYYISTYLSRSNDGGESFHDTRVSQAVWDPAVNSPTSVSGKFIGDYQGLVADDEVAIPFWNDTQLAALPKDDKRRSPYQEVFSARIPNGPATFVDAAATPLSVRAYSAQARRAAANRRRVLRITGIATDPGTGKKVDAVEVSVRRRLGRGQCHWYSPRRQAFVRRACDRAVWFRASGAQAWGAAIRRTELRKGVYLVQARAISSAGKRETRLEPLRNQRKLRVR